MEQAIEAKYGLREVVIADTGDEQDEQLLLPAPGLVSSKRTLRALVSDPGIQSVFTAYESLSLLLVGIGSLAPSPLLQPSGNAVADTDQQLLRAAGAVGDVCLRFFDDNGAHVRTLHDRVVGIGAAALRAVPRRVGVAGGLRKVSAIDAALRGGWVNVLVTDYQVATRLAEGRDA